MFSGANVKMFVHRDDVGIHCFDVKEMCIVMVRPMLHHHINC